MKGETTEPLCETMRQLPLYKCHKQVWALKIAGIAPEEMPKFSRSVCKGSIALGSACGTCERCEHEKKFGPGLGALIIPEDAGYTPFHVTAAYLAKHKPKVGGYWVQYKDGYQSFSPADAFEEGYMRI